ncbi:2'-5' RNA ligase family protein [Amycolatopsis cynarae]|uniref:2'-5' RNA ligase family protein n=1 Tax=Amycolatopsis cynarae TaxID=2995223 RepID=A0ABY7ATJ8_9PSEU|nr:2'-5' RNA ligase family protein [Amycolatopsis sp. HUAS 11-8]WAL63231.1 2'-5' RNA ligase family protein [Amycolatopsis sp. HUAS 11-8]
MALAVCLLFDGRSERALRNLWDRLEGRGVPTLRSHTHGLHHPHLSYVVLRDWELEPVRAAMDGVPGHDPFEITFDALGAFPRGRACLIPAVRADLVPRQELVVETVRAAGAGVHKHYEIGRWLPHSSLAPRVRAGQLPVLAETIYSVLPLTVRVNRAALIDSSTGRLWPLPTLP